MGLSAVGTTGEPRIYALGHDSHQDLLGLFQVRQEQALKLAAAVGILRKILELLQGQAQMAFTDLLPEGLRSPEKSVGQLLDLPRAEFFATQGRDELVKGLGAV